MFVTHKNKGIADKWILIGFIEEIELIRVKLCN